MTTADPKIKAYLERTKLIWGNSPKYTREDGKEVLIRHDGEAPMMVSVHLSNYMSEATVQVGYAYIEDGDEAWHDGFPPGL
jgi:hypothetical protein